MMNDLAYTLNLVFFYKVINFINEEIRRDIIIVDTRECCTYTTIDLSILE